MLLQYARILTESGFFAFAEKLAFRSRHRDRQKRSCAKSRLVSHSPRSPNGASWNCHMKTTKKVQMLRETAQWRKVKIEKRGRHGGRNLKGVRGTGESSTEAERRLTNPPADRNQTHQLSKVKL